MIQRQEEQVQGQQAARQIYRETEGQVQPGPKQALAIMKARQKEMDRNAAAQINDMMDEAESGIPADLADALQRGQERLNSAQANFTAGVMGAVNGQNQQVANLEWAARRVQQQAQTNRNGGHP